jgi:hypothetical protein
MRKYLVFVFILLNFSLFSQAIDVEIVQSGKKVNIKSKTIHLKKTDFEFVVSFSKKTEDVYSIYLNLSYDDVYFANSKSDTAPEVKNLLFYTIAETPFNKSKKIYLDIEAFHYLGPKFVSKGEERHNFDTLIERSDRYVGIRKVKYFDDRKQSFTVREIEKPLYVYILALSKDNTSKNTLENLKNENVCYRLHKKIVWKQDFKIRTKKIKNYEKNTCCQSR